MCKAITVKELEDLIFSKYSFHKDDVKSVKLIIRECDQIFNSHYSKKISQLSKDVEHQDSFYLPRMERIKEYLKSIDHWNESTASIFANGTNSPCERPTYLQKINLLQNQVEALKTEVSKLQKQLNFELDRNTMEHIGYPYIKILENRLNVVESILTSISEHHDVTVEDNSTNVKMKLSDFSFFKKCIKYLKSRGINDSSSRD